MSDFSCINRNILFKIPLDRAMRVSISFVVINAGKVRHICSVSQDKSKRASKFTSSR